MTTLAQRQAVQAGPALSLDDHLTLTHLTMDERLNKAGVKIAVSTAHIDIPEAPEILTAPIPATASRPATVADVYCEAARLIRTHGWIRGYVGNAQTGYCLIGAIRKAAGGNRRLEDAAERTMLERIRRQFPDALSVGSWHDAQSGPEPVLRMLG